VSDHLPDRVPEPGADLEYDLAHETSGAGTVVGPEEQPRETPVIATPAYDGGDYSYDLAHGFT
jgi:hypothetical protein